MSTPRTATPRELDAHLVRGAPASPARDDAERLLGTAPDPFDRTAAEHVTASALVVDASNRRVLLVHHAKLGLWVQPGGHVEPQDERVAHAALREAQEETGVADLVLGGGALHVDRHPAPCLPPGAGVHLDLLHLCVSPDDAVPAVSSESHDVRWFDVDALPDDAVPGLADRLRERPQGTWRERNDADHRRLLGFRDDLPWVREVLRRHDEGDPGTVVAGGMRTIVLTTEEAASRGDLP